MKKLVLTSLLALLITSIAAFAGDKILFVTSNQQYYGNTSLSTANHFEEIVIPYHLLSKAGYKIDFVSPKGGAIPLGYINTADSLQKQYLYNVFFMDQLEHTAKPGEIKLTDYLAIFYSGGGSAMYGIADDSILQKIAQGIYANNGIIGAICHGTYGLVNLKAADGKALYAGKKITGYPNQLENKTMDYYKTIPFMLNETIQQNGGEFVYSPKGKDAFFVVDGRWVSGQDPSSAWMVANEVIKLLQSNKDQNNRSDAKSEDELITSVLMDYIDGTANGEPERLRRAFHPDFKLYTVAKDTLWVRSGEQYIANIKPGEKSNRIGKIISIDIEKDAAIAKAEIFIPGWRIFTDYFLLLKYKGEWKIVQKSYSWREAPKAN